MKYWLHRISYHAEVAYPLVERGCLSTGWVKVAAEKECLAEMNKFAAAGDFDAAWRSFERAHQNAAYGDITRARYALWHFLVHFQPGDCVLVPSWWGTFSLYKIASGAFTPESLKFDRLSDWNNNPLTFREDGIYRGEERIDLGFFRKVEAISEASELSRADYAGAALTSRMKVRQTTVDISDLAQEIEEVIQAAKSGKKPSVYGAVMEPMRNALLDAMRSRLTPDKLERLVVWYLRKCGADGVTIPAKNAPDKKDGADADVVAAFENIKVVLYVQVKHHTETTSEWAVEQISRYKEQKEDAGGEYHYIPWVVSTGDKFSDEAIRLAGINRVRLIDGSAFAAMLIDKGLQNIDEAF
jgi:hypothetical protein